jgi:hypothetical protein
MPVTATATFTTVPRKGKSSRIVLKPSARKDVPPPLLALGLMLEGNDCSLRYVVGSLADALRDADKLLAGIYERAADATSHESLEQCAVHDLVFSEVAKSAEYKKLEAMKGADPSGVVSEAIDQALLLGVALAYRYFVPSGAR